MTIKILHIIETLEVGGMENGVVNIVNAIGDAFPSVIFCTKARGPLADKVVNKEAVYYKKCKESLLVITWLLFKYCLSNRPDILHTHGWGTLISGFIVSKLLRIKLIHGEHGTVYFNSRKDVIVQKFMLSKTDKNLFVSNSLASLFKEKLNLTHKVRVIHNGVDSLRFKKQKVDIKKYFPGFENKTIIGAVGRLVPVKNHIWLIEALCGFLGDSVKLVIVGSGPLHEELSKVIRKLNLENDVLLFGESSEPEVLMNGFDVFVLPSISEGLSNTVLEAMSCGLPVVASDVGGNSELIINSVNGYLFELNELSDFNERMKTLVDSAEVREKFSIASKRSVDEKFSLQVMINNYQNVYSEVASNG